VRNAEEVEIAGPALASNPEPVYIQLPHIQGPVFSADERLALVNQAVALTSSPKGLNADCGGLLFKLALAPIAKDVRYMAGGDEARNPIGRFVLEDQASANQVRWRLASKAAAFAQFSDVTV
jgi:hypothetical protein